LMFRYHHWATDWFQLYLKRIDNEALTLLSFELVPKALVGIDTSRSKFGRNCERAFCPILRRVHLWEGKRSSHNMVDSTSDAIIADPKAVISKLFGMILMNGANDRCLTRSRKARYRLRFRHSKNLQKLVCDKNASRQGILPLKNAIDVDSSTGYNSGQRFEDG
jgi:hypothetical protein